MATTGDFYMATDRPSVGVRSGNQMILGGVEWANRSRRKSRSLSSWNLVHAPVLMPSQTNFDTSTVVRRVIPQGLASGNSPGVGLGVGFTGPRSLAMRTRIWRNTRASATMLDVTLHENGVSRDAFAASRLGEQRPR